MLYLFFAKVEKSLLLIRSKSLKAMVESITNGTNNKNNFKSSSVIEKISLKTKMPQDKPKTMVAKRISFNKLNGLQILYNINKPVYEVNITDRVEATSAGSLNIKEKAQTNKIFATTVIAPGKEFFNIFKKKLPFNLSLVGSNERIKDGIPIVKALVNVICIGIKGYCIFKNKNTIAKIVE